MNIIQTFLFLLISTIALGQNEKRPQPKEIFQEKKIDIAIYDFNGIEPLLYLKNDTTYIINFWATWCIPCVAELPYFEKIQAQYAAQKVKVILVSLDFSDKISERLIPFMQKQKLKSEVCLLDDPDANTWIEKVDKNWTGAIPATLIYNSHYRAFFEKSFTYEELEKVLLLSQKTNN